MNEAFLCYSVMFYVSGSGVEVEEVGRGRTRVWAKEREVMQGRERSEARRRGK